MNSQIPIKINKVLQEIVSNVVITRTWLKTMGISRQLANKYVKNGWLQRIGTNAFIRQNNIVEWYGGLYAIQNQLKKNIYIGGRTALELTGKGHFIPLNRLHFVRLIGDKDNYLPKWFMDLSKDVNIHYHRMSLFAPKTIKSNIQISHQAFELTVSSNEKAILEEINFAQTNDDIDYIILLLEGLMMLRPKILQNLLENCRSVKVKRFFLWCSEQMDFPWFKKLDVSRIDLGHGRRQFYKGGKIDPKYKINVPLLEGLPDV